MDIDYFGVFNMLSHRSGLAGQDMSDEYMG